jgi:uncharacterized tellurite resistance protein B-like protein
VFGARQSGISRFSTSQVDRCVRSRSESGLIKSIFSRDINFEVAIQNFKNEAGPCETKWRFGSGKTLKFGLQREWLCSKIAIIFFSQYPLKLVIPKLGDTLIYLNLTMNFREILELFRQGKATAKSHIKNLIEIATADGKFAEEEHDLLVSIASRNGISRARLEEIKSFPGAIVFEVPPNDREKFNQIYDLVHMMIIDKSIHPEEVRLCEIFAGRFGYEKNRIKELLETIRHNIDNGNDAPKTYERVLYYLKVKQLQ